MVEQLFCKMLEIVTIVTIVAIVKETKEADNHAEYLNVGVLLVGIPF